MPILNALRNSEAMRWPLLAITRLLLMPLKCGPAVFRRVFYDAFPCTYLVTGRQEHFVIATQDKVIGKGLFLRGEFDFHKLETALAVLKREGRPKPAHLIDVGANVGSIVIPAITRGLVQGASAVEPHPDNLRLLRTNLALNQITDQVSVFNVAAGARSDSNLLLRECHGNSGNHAIGDAGISVAEMRLDDLAIPLENSLLWMDIEGYEGHALEGASRMLDAGMPVVSEFNPRFLDASGGSMAFETALGHRKLYDLGNDAKETSFSELMMRYATSETDILAI